MKRTRQLPLTARVLWTIVVRDRSGREFFSGTTLGDDRHHRLAQLIVANLARQQRRGARVYMTRLPLGEDAA